MSNKNKKSGIIFAAWTVGALIVLIAFLVNGNKIIGNLKTTDFFERVFGSGTTPEFVKNHKEEKPKSNGLLEVEVEEPKITEKPQITQPEIPQNQKQEITEKTETKPEVETIPAVPSPKEEKTEITETPQITPPPAPKPLNLHLFFVLIDSDGTIARKESVRSTTKRDAPLTASIEMLLSGPTVQERNSGYISLVPSGTKLLSAYIKNGIAVLNFSEAFEYNTFGVEGYLGQLMQIVYTATSFSTVDSVQFLIEGQKKDYLGSEGVWIGSPLARTSFK